MKNKGFTLAEFLVTLTVIGVLAALIIPSIAQRVQYAQLRSMAKETYSMLDQATKRAALNNGGTFKGLASDHTAFKDAYKPYLNYIKECNDGEGVDKGCWHAANDGYGLDGAPYTWEFPFHPGLVLNNGVLLNMHHADENCDTICGQIYFDVNGFKGPNTLGRDVFYTQVTENGIKPKQDESCCNATSLNSYEREGVGCIVKILRNIDY